MSINDHVINQAIPCINNIYALPIDSNNAEDILQNLLEKFERLYNNSQDSSVNVPNSKKTFNFDKDFNWKIFFRRKKQFYSIKQWIRSIALEYLQIK